ncbi:MAG TPA: bifunctional hydroxymethylpyrimidine kinase/phosphomethylpyrimidine kinase [Candidatus Blautia faecigallinarum]|uniref:Bifunctional hydroxymethylpyrimidine kinase/phosphomethylpyrimidine kinase n=1 Tax=Candidatus Blautia faecigallinarum TaxID=2838488 RepID=A0A9D2DQW3_9FIRM|nr:bifunctional hydroxymethylpyrimidine kinase/phosphomethylpyrimidine kinase [Candidatus Blautia faecigallinarum]
MKKILVIGSTVVDVIIELMERLPRTGEDVHVRRQQMSLGGCAFNVSESIRHFQVPYILFSPVGTGTYGHFVREELHRRGISSPIPTPDKDNGCCYCFVENTGERTFVCDHGAEYLFREEWFRLLDLEEIDSVYICGLEIEESTGPVIVDFLEKNPRLKVFFAPGPRISRIDPWLLARLFCLSPVLHLNETEVLSVTEENSVSQAARALYEKTHNTVIVTLGANGCYYFDGEKEETIPAFSVNLADTIGAGDSHIGSVMACLKKGDPLPKAIAKANMVAAAVVGTTSALLPDEEFEKLKLL